MPARMIENMSEMDMAFDDVVRGLLQDRYAPAMDEALPEELVRLLDCLDGVDEPMPAPVPAE
jgi:hypothetical protein